MSKKHPKGCGCGCDPKLLEQRTHFMLTLPLVLKDLWPDGCEFNLTIMDQEGDMITEMGGPMADAGFWRN